MDEGNVRLPAEGMLAAAECPDVELDWSHNPTGELTSWAECFRSAALTLLRETSGQRSLAAREACPIVFLYRHALELYLKALLLDRSRLARLHGQAPPFPIGLLSTHKLEPLLRPLELLFRPGWHWHLRAPDLLGFDAILSLLRELDAVDPQSYGFRYPVDKTFSSPSLPTRLRIDLSSLAQRAEEILNTLRIVASGLDFEIDTVYLSDTEGRDDEGGS